MECIKRSIPVENHGIILVGISSDYLQNKILSSSQNKNMPVYRINSYDHIKLYSHQRYDIYLDLGFSYAYKAMLNILNMIIPYNGKINIYLIKCNSKVIDSKLSDMLNRLQNYGLISLLDSGINIDSQAQLDNVVFFLSPVGCGSSSLIASISDICKSNKKSSVVIDLSKRRKLINYFNNFTAIDDRTIKQIAFDFLIKDANTHFYTYSPSIGDKNSQIIYLCEFITKLSSIYDLVLISTDESTAANMPQLFKMSNRHIAVLDSQPISSAKVKAMALNLMLNGINTKKTLSVIYNKINPSKNNIRDIEERTFFVQLPKRKLISILGIDSPAIDIPFEKNISRSTNYKKAIEKIYMNINDMLYVEDDEKDVIVYIKEKLKQLENCHLIKNMLSHIKHYYYNNHILNFKKQL